jgi:hypothetical protein
MSNESPSSAPDADKPKTAPRGKRLKNRSRLNQDGVHLMAYQHQHFEQVFKNPTHTKGTQQFDYLDLSQEQRKLPP